MRVRRALALSERALPGRGKRCDVGHEPRVPGRVLAQLLDAHLRGFQIAGQMPELLGRRIAHEILAHQCSQLLLQITRGLRPGFGLRQLFQQRGALGQDRRHQTRKLLRQQAKARAPLLAALLEAWFVLGPGLHQTGLLHRRRNDLVAQLLLRAEIHVQHGHPSQVRQILFQIAHRFAQGKQKEAAQAGRMHAAGLLRVVEHVQIAGVSAVAQGRIADERLPVTMDFQQFGKAPEAPGGDTFVIQHLRRCAVARRKLLKRCLGLAAVLGPQLVQVAPA
ncbi:hypothetical protein CDEF62S_01680 [Castellaniella defragrans]